MASIRKRGNTYRIQVFLGRDTEDKAQFVTVSYKPTATTPKAIEKEVDTYAREFEKQVKEGKYLSGEKLTYKDITERWKADWAADHLADGGAQYLDMIKRYAYPAFGMMKISKIRPLHVQTLVDEMKEKGLSAATIRRATTAFNSVFRYAYRLQIIQENPYDRVERPRMEKGNELHYFTPKQAKAFLCALRGPYTDVVKAHDRIDDTGKKYHVEEYERVLSYPLQHQLYFYLAIYGGFRRGEECALTWRDIDFKNHTVTVSKAVARRKSGQIIKEPKTAAGCRTITLPDVCFDLLTEWRKEQKRQRLAYGTAWKGAQNMEDQYIFMQDNGALIDISTIRKRFHAIIDRYNASCKNEEDKLPQIKLHDLRHTAATLLVANGCDYATISHRLGHSKVSVTLDIYSHPLPENDIAASNILEKVLSAAVN